MWNYTRNEWGICAKLHSKRVEKMRNYTRNEYIFSSVVEAQTLSQLYITPIVQYDCKFRHNDAALYLKNLMNILPQRSCTTLLGKFRELTPGPRVGKYTRNECERLSFTLETSGEDGVLNSKRVEKMEFYTRNESRRSFLACKHSICIGGPRMWTHCQRSRISKR